MYYPKPDWVVYATEVDASWDVSTGEKTVTYRLEVGEHAIYVGTIFPQGLWFCGPLSVVGGSH
jgi:hypothetical protein